MAYTAVIQARNVAEGKLGTLRAAVKLSEERAMKSSSSATDSKKETKK